MLKSVIVGKKVDGVVQATKVMVLSGDRIVLVDATTGQPPKKIVTKIIGKDLHIFTEDAAEPSVILSDYTSFQDSVHISGIGAGGSYVDYPVAQNTAVEFDPNAVAPAAPAVAESSGISGTTILLGALAIGGIAAAAGGGGGGGGSSTPAATTVSGYLIDSAVKGVAYTTSSGLSGTTGADGSFSYKAGDTVTFKVGNATIGTFSTASINTDGKIYLQDLVGISRGTTDAKSINIAQFLQTLDSDNDPSNGITIDSTVASKIPTIDVQTATDAQLLAAIQTANPAITALVTETAATNHLTDVTSPTAAITLSDTTLNSGETATVTVTFSEAVKNFSNADVTVQNGTLSTLKSTDGGITWTATFTPTANLSDTTNVITIGTNYTDTAGNAGTAVTSGNYVVDTTVAPPSPPSVTITDDENSVGNIAGGTITYTFTFSESVTGFTADDVVVTHGTKGAFSGSGTTYTLVVTPESGYEGNMSVSVPAGSAIGVTSGGQNTAAVSAAQTIDTSAPVAPTFALASDTGTSATDGITNVTTVNVSGLESGASWEYSLNGGSTWTTGSGTSFTLANNATYAVDAIQVRQTDAAGNVGTIQSNADVIVTDKTAPTVEITNDVTAAIANIADGSILYTFTFNEAVSGFTVNDVTVTNGSKGTFTKVSDTEYTLAVRPTTGMEGDVTVSVSSGMFNDLAGNVNTADTVSVQAVDLLTPSVSSITLSDTDLTPGETSIVTITFSEEVKDFSNTDIDLSGANGALSTLVSSDNITWTALFTPTADVNNDTSNVIRVLNTYTDMAGNAGSIDSSGSFTVNTANATSTSDTVKPKITINDNEDSITANMDGTNADGTTDADGGDILYTFTFDEAVKNFDITDITVTMEKTDGTVESTYTSATDTNGLVFRTFTKVSDTVYTLGVHPEAGYEGVMRVSVSGSDVTDLAGNALDTSDISSLSSLQAVDMRAPFPDPLLHGSLTVSAYDVEHQRLVLNFDENLEQVNQVDPGNFGVMINGTEVIVKAVGVSDNSAGMADNQVFLYLEPVYNARGESFDWQTAGITVSYTDTGADLTPIIQDLAGNDATTFNDYIADTLAPDAKITVSDTQLTSGETATITFAFNEAVNLSLSDLDFTNANGSIDTLSTEDGGKTWTGTFTPDINTTSVTNYITLNGTYTDGSGNLGIDNQSTSFFIDTQAPLLNSAVSKTGVDFEAHTWTFTFSEVLDAVNFADTTMFYATDGVTYDTNDPTKLVHFEITSVSISGSTATVSIDPSIDSNTNTKWTITYTDQPGNDTNALQDIYGADVSSFTLVSPVI